MPSISPLKWHYWCLYRFHFGTTPYTTAATLAISVSTFDAAIQDYNDETTTDTDREEGEGDDEQGD